jgi:hypothetical protein
MYRLLMLAGAVIVAGCATPAPPPGDPRDVPPIIVAGPLLRVSIRLVNPSPADRPVLQTTDWTDVNKLPVRTLMSAPQRLTVPRFGDATIQVIAPNPRAVNFNTRIEPDFSAGNPS